MGWINSAFKLGKWFESLLKNHSAFALRDLSPAQGVCTHSHYYRVNGMATEYLPTL
jgi:hypothetical protein